MPLNGIYSQDDNLETLMACDLHPKNLARRFGAVLEASRIVAQSQDLSIGFRGRINAEYGIIGHNTLYVKVV